MARSSVYERELDAKILWDDENSEVRFGLGGLLKIKKEVEDADVENDETDMVDEGLCVSSVDNNKDIEFQFKNDSTDQAAISQKKSSPNLILKIHDSLTKTEDNCNTVKKKRKMVSREELGIHEASNAKKKFKPEGSKPLEDLPSSSELEKVRKRVEIRVTSTKNYLKKRLKSDITKKTAKSLPKSVDESRNNLIHKCEDCGRCFQNREILRAHTYYYSDSGPHQCNLCNASFTKPDLLLQHLKSVHPVIPNEKLYKYKCKFCTARFSRKIPLTQHLLHFHKKPIDNSSEIKIRQKNRNNDFQKNTDNDATTSNNIHRLDADDAKYKTSTVEEVKENSESVPGNHHLDENAKKSKHSLPVTLVDSGTKKSLMDSPNIKSSALKINRKTRIAEDNIREKVLAAEYEDDESKSPKMQSMPLRRTRSSSLKNQASGSPAVAANITNISQKASQSSTNNMNFEQSDHRTDRSRRSFEDEQLESVSMNKENIRNLASEIVIDDVISAIGRKGISSNRSESIFSRTANKVSALNPHEHASKLASLETPGYKSDDDRNDSNTPTLPSEKDTACGNRCPKGIVGKDEFRYVCKYCPRSFNDKPNLAAHYRWEHDRLNPKLNKRKCILCSQSFRDETNLIGHYISVHMKSISGFIECCVCQVPVSGLTKMKQHLINHHRRLNARHIKKFCRQCHQKLSTLWLREYCSLCKPNKFRKKSIEAVSRNFQDNQQLSDSLPPVPVSSDNTETCTSLRTSGDFKCSDCDCVFQDDDQLKDHQRTLHGILECTEQNKARDISKSTHIRTVRRIKPIQKLPCNKNVRLKSSSRNEEIVKSEKDCKHDKHCVKKLRIGKRLEFYARGTNNLRFNHKKKQRKFYDTKCNVCGLNCCCISSLKLHKKRYSIWGRNTCNICGLRFVLKTMLLTHMKSAHNPKLLPFYRLRCEICRQGFYNKKFLRIHLSHFHNIKYYQCQICKIRFDNAKRLNNHMRYYSKILGPRLICDICGETFECKYMFRYHQTQAHDAKKLKSFKYCCDICNCTFPNELLLQAHIGHFHAAQEIKVDALMTTDENSSNPVSDTIFELNDSVSKLQDLSDNQDMIKADEECKNKIVDESTTATTWTHNPGQYKCTTCKISFNDPYDLLNHEWEFSNEGTKQCNVCERKFTKNRHLITHRLKHIRDVNEKLDEHECNICKEDFSSLEQLKIHGLHLHGPQFSWETDSQTTANASNTLKKLNGKGVVLFFQKIGLNRKLPNTLSSPRCDYCQKMFNNVASLGTHMRKHAYQAYYTNSSRYLCLICKHKFRTNDVLRAHVIHYHTFDRKKSNITEPETDCLKKSHDVGTEPNNHCDSTSRQFSEFVDYSVTQRTNPNSQSCQDGQAKKQTISDAQSKSLLSLEDESQHVICSKPTKGEICLGKVATHQSLQNHCNSYIGKGRFRCNFCEAEFSTETSKKIHVSKSHGNERTNTLPTDISTKKSMNESKEVIDNVVDHQSSLKKMVKSSLLEDKSLRAPASCVKVTVDQKKCIICDQFFFSHQNLMSCCESCLAKDRFKCAMCDAEFFSKNSLLLHVRRIHGSESRGKLPQSSGNENSIEETENASVLPTELSIDQQLLKIGRVRVKPFSDTSLISQNKKKYHENEGRQRRVKYLKKREGDLLEEFNVSIANNDSIIQGEGNGRPHQILVDKVGTANQFTNNRQTKTIGQQKKSGPSACDLHLGESIPRIIRLKKIPENRNTEKHFLITSKDSIRVQPSSTTTLSKDEESEKLRKKGIANPPQSSVNQFSLQPAFDSAEYDFENFSDQNRKQLTSIKPTVSASSVVSEKQTDHSNPKISNTDDVIRSTNLVTLLSNIDTKSSATNDRLIKDNSHTQKVASHTDRISNSDILCQSATVSSSSNNSDQIVKVSGIMISQSLKHESVSANKTHVWKLVAAVRCSYCKLLFSEKVKLLEHMKSHRSENQVSACSTTLFNKDVVSKRLNEHKCSVCKNCKVSFFPKVVDAHSPGTELFCSKCKTVPPLPTKTMTERSDLRPMTCGLCMKSFNSIPEVMNHFKLNHLKFVCGICDFKSLIEKVLLTHMQQHIANGSTIEAFPCKTCKKYFLGVSDLAKHELSHSQKIH